MSVALDGHLRFGVLDQFFPLGMVLRRVIKRGSLGIIDASGITREFGCQGSGPQSTIRLHKRSLAWTLLRNTELRFGEAYMDGAITIEKGSLRDLLDLVALNSKNGSLVPWQRAIDWLLPLQRKLQQHNPIRRARANVAHHYDLSDQLYDVFLDVNRQYSCADFRHPEETLEAAQLNKMRHLAVTLLIQPGMRVLEIGSGWGGLALYLARETGADVTGLTLSEEQHRYASQRATQAGLASQSVVVAPSLIPKRAGDRVKTDRRDAASPAKLHRAAELTAVWVPDARHEARQRTIRHAPSGQGWGRGRGRENPRIHYLPDYRSDAGR
jgi:hypothetical protein